MSSALKRILSSVVLIPVCIAAIWYGGIALCALLGLCIIISLVEWTNLSFRLTPSAIKRLTLLLVGLVYISFSFSMVAMIGLSGFGVPEEGKEWILFLFLTIWSSDTLAYVIGKNFGGPKMTPTISPNKTWSGYAGALLGPALTLTFCIHVLTPFSMIEHTPPGLLTFLAGAVIGVVGQAGDLLISYMKRKAGIKDTGNLIPGHGGILDRIDALLLVVPVYAAYILLIHPEY